MRLERIRLLNDKDYKDGSFVLYRMQASVRVVYNLALYEAIRIANQLQLPLKVIFRLDPAFPESNYRHFRFMVDGLLDFALEIEKIGATFELLEGDPENVFTPFINHAACVVTDKGYLAKQREWSDWLAANAPCRVIEVEDNLIVPVMSASHKREWAARTLRPKLLSKLEYFAEDVSCELPELSCRVNADNGIISKNRSVMAEALEKVRSHSFLFPVSMKGGAEQAEHVLHRFVADKLRFYENNRNDPSLHGTSGLSPYLHFGQISPLLVFKQISSFDYAAPFIEQFVVRRELAYNFVFHTPGYDTYEALPVWCRRTLSAHRSDPRPRLYTLKQLDDADTYDIYWNAAMIEMKKSGFMENTMRMYWGKKIIEWTGDPEEAYVRMSYLNNRYFLDGRDANSYAGIGWCFGLHDRPWSQRPVFGTVRYMNEAGLKRKYSMEAYVKKWLT